jgi:hypothetical protein
MKHESVEDASRSQFKAKIKPGAIKKDQIFRELFPLENSD